MQQKQSTQTSVEQKYQPPAICNICRDGSTCWKSGPMFKAICCGSHMHLNFALYNEKCNECGESLGSRLENTLNIALDYHVAKWTAFKNSQEQQRLQHKKEAARIHLQVVIDLVIKPAWRKMKKDKVIIKEERENSRNAQHHT